MSHRFLRVVLALALLFVAPRRAPRVAQGLTGQISGVVTDNGGGVMPGATVTVKNVGTNLVAKTTTGADGSVRHHEPARRDVRSDRHASRASSPTSRRASSSAPPSAWRCARSRSRSAGCRKSCPSPPSRSKCRRRAASDRRRSPPPRSRTSACSGRDFMGSLKVLPGVIDTSVRDAPGWGSVGSMSINGQTSFNFSYDGVTNKDTGSNSGNYAAPALDSIAEVKVQASNFQAEYGRSSGATITVVTKSGTRDFQRHRGVLQAQRKVQHQHLGPPAPVRRAGQAGELRRRRRTGSTTRRGRIGGPVLIPGTDFNQQPRQAVLLLLAGPAAAQRSRARCS